jgi:hypothetical protein
MKFNGHEISLPGWIRFGIQVALLLFAISGIYFKVDNRVSNLESQVHGNTAAIASMDTNGTHKSHETDYGQQTQIDDLGRRVSNLEAILRDLVPKVERIDTNVLVLMTRENNRKP